MSELSKLVGKGKKVQIGELEIEVRPLTVSSMPLLMELGVEDLERQGKAIKELITLTLKDAIPDATEDEIEKVPLEYMTSIMEAIMDVNKLEIDSQQKKEFLAKIKAK